MITTIGRFPLDSDRYHTTHGMEMSHDERPFRIMRHPTQPGYLLFVRGRKSTPEWYALFSSAIAAMDQYVRGKHAPDCDVSTGKHARGSWDDLELPGDCTCKPRKE